MFTRAILVSGLLVLAGASGSADAKQAIASFDPAGSISTYPFSINNDGAVTGYYADSNYVEHGFVRAADGTIATFDPAGAANTVPSGINTEGAIAGTWWDSSTVAHGFVRAADGTITSFDPHGSINTTAVTIDRAGAVAGNYADSNWVEHGFCARAREGSSPSILRVRSTPTWAA